MARRLPRRAAAAPDAPEPTLDAPSAIDDAPAPLDAPACCAGDADCPTLEGYPQICRRGRCRIGTTLPTGACWSDVDCPIGEHCVGGLPCECPETCADSGVGSCAH